MATFSRCLLLAALCLLIGTAMGRSSLHSGDVTGQQTNRQLLQAAAAAAASGGSDGFDGFVPVEHKKVQYFPNPGNYYYDNYRQYNNGGEAAAAAAAAGDDGAAAAAAATG